MASGSQDQPLSLSFSETRAEKSLGPTPNPGYVPTAAYPTSCCFSSPIALLCTIHLPHLPFFCSSNTFNSFPDGGSLRPSCLFCLHNSPRFSHGCFFLIILILIPGLPSKEHSRTTSFNSYPVTLSSVTQFPSCQEPCHQLAVFWVGCYLPE